MFVAFVILFFFSVGAKAQKVSAEVFNGWGKTFKVSSHTYDGSIGESSITTLKAGGYVITQGFLQPIDLKVPCGNVVLKTFPNPVLSELKIYAEGCDVEVAIVQAYDLFGKLVYQGEPLKNEIDLSGIGVGVYLIRAFDSNENVLGVVKVLKTTI